MDNMSEKCSTPEYGHKNITLNFNLSVILANSIDLTPSIKENSLKKQQTQQRRETDHDPFSDSEYETVDVREIYYHEHADDDKTTDTITPENFLPDNSSPLSIRIFQSPSDTRYDNYFADLWEDDTPSIPHDSFIPSPGTSLCVGSPSRLKNYAGPGKGKRKLDPEAISFSPKWENRVASKYGSPSQIPWRNSSSTSLPQITEQHIVAKKSRSKYTHLQVQTERFRSFNSPTRIYDLPDENSVCAGRVYPKNKSPLGKSSSQNRNATVIREQGNNNGSKANTRLRRNKSHDVKRSNLSPRKLVKFSSYEADDFEIESEDSLKENNRSMVQKKSKPKIVSIEILKKANN